MIVEWTRYEIENYVVTPDLLREWAAREYRDLPLFDRFELETEEVLDGLVLERAFGGREADFRVWKDAEPEVARLLWEARTEGVKLSDFAEEFFRRLASRLGHYILLRKGDLHRLVAIMEPKDVPEEVSEKLDLLAALFAEA